MGLRSEGFGMILLRVVDVVGFCWGWVEMGFGFGIGSGGGLGVERGIGGR